MKKHQADPDWRMFHQTPERRSPKWPDHPKQGILEKVSQSRETRNRGLNAARPGPGPGAGKGGTNW